jgi:hypothetical protein
MTPDPPIRFSYDAEAAIRTATYTGTVDDASLVQAYRDLIAQPGFDPLAHDLADLRGVERIEVTPVGLRDLGTLMAGDPAQPRSDAVAGLAIVATTPVAFGLARMFELLTQGHLPKDTRVFRDFDEAMRWLRARPRLGGAGTR